ncbi:MAG: HAD family hydrolase [Deltaproteobacteria bacterium]|nr:HAD family hydrolase [Deltaproteobacteria bacterium]
MSRSAAFFDMDHTLLLANSAPRYVRWRVSRGELPRSELARSALWLAQYSLGLLDVNALATKVSAPYRGTPEATLRSEIAAWTRAEVLPLLSSLARAALASEQAQGRVCVLLTSATAYAAEPVAAAVGIPHVLCSSLEVDDGVFTGRAVFPLCYGEGKVTMAERWSAAHGVDLASSTFYTDSISDRPMLERVGHPRVVNPDARLAFLALRRGWSVQRWSE